MFLNLSFSSSYVALLIMSIICIITIILHYAYCYISGNYTFFCSGLISVVLYWNYQYMYTLLNTISLFILFFLWMLSVLIYINYMKVTTETNQQDYIDIESQNNT